MAPTPQRPSFLKDILDLKVRVNRIRGQLNDMAVGSGPTANRPVTPATGQSFFDTTLNIPVWWNGTGWVNSSGSAS